MCPIEAPGYGFSFAQGSVLRGSVGEGGLVGFYDDSTTISEHPVFKTRLIPAASYGENPSIMVPIEYQVAWAPTGGRDEQ